MSDEKQAKSPINLVQAEDDLIGRLALASLVISYIQSSEGSNIDLTQASLTPEFFQSLRQAAKSTLDTYSVDVITSYKQKAGEEVRNSALTLAITDAVSDRLRAQTAELSNMNDTISNSFTEQTKLIHRSTHWAIQLIVSVVAGFLFGVFVYVAKLLPNPF